MTSRIGLGQAAERPDSNVTDFEYESGYMKLQAGVPGDAAVYFSDAEYGQKSGNLYFKFSTTFKNISEHLQMAFQFRMIYNKRNVTLTLRLFEDFANGMANFTTNTSADILILHCRQVDFPENNGLFSYELFLNPVIQVACGEARLDNITADLALLGRFTPTSSLNASIFSPTFIEAAGDRYMVLQFEIMNGYVIMKYPEWSIAPKDDATLAIVLVSVLGVGTSATLIRRKLKKGGK